MNKVFAVSGAIVLVATLAACSSDEGTDGSGGTPAPASSEASPAPSGSSTETPIGGDPAVWAPVEVNPLKREKPVDLVPGQRMILFGIDDIPGYRIMSDNPGVAGPERPGPVRPGMPLEVVAMAPGTTTIILMQGGEEIGNPIVVRVAAPKE